MCDLKQILGNKHDYYYGHYPSSPFFKRNVEETGCFRRVQREETFLHLCAPFNQLNNNLMKQTWCLDKQRRWTMYITIIMFIVTQHCQKHSDLDLDSTCFLHIGNFLT
jgi:hypothetical protein